MDKINDLFVENNEDYQIKNDQTNYILEYLMKMTENNQNKKIKISIEGNIASGKSTIINYLKQKIESSFDLTKPKLNLEIHPEPVNLWRNLNGNNLLDLMYKDLNKWAFPFNVYAQLTLLQNHIKMNNDSRQLNGTQNHSINIMERSIHSARFCFIENFMKSNTIHSAEYDILDKWYNWILENNDCSLDILFYLRTSPETCLNRVLKRGRPEEINSISLEYLQDLHNFHENWLNKETSSEKILNYYKPLSVIIIDANQPVDDVYKTIENKTRNAVSMAN